MKKVVTCEQMKRLDQQTFDRFHLPSIVLMERAALSVFEFIREKRENIYKEHILIVCGSGNNGGDGIAIARLLHLAGYQVSCFLAGSVDKMTEQTSAQYQCALAYKVPFIEAFEEGEFSIIIDAMFGVGLSRSISGKYYLLLKQMNEMQGLKIAVDIPSGVNGDTGEIMGIAFRADYTITFAYLKQGLCLPPARIYAGEIKVADIGIYDTDGEIHRYELERTDVSMIPERLPLGNKGTFGKVLILAGAKGMSGAAYLCAAAAFGAGAGMVLIHTPECNRTVLQTLLPEAMVSCEFSENEYQRLFEWCDVLVLGPGIGMSNDAKEHMQRYLEINKSIKKPVIIDADGLNLLSVNSEWSEFFGRNVIVTPHIGEMARLTGKTISEIKTSPIQNTQDYTKQNNVICVLKDAISIICGKNSIYINTGINPGLATAGSGDVLSGTIAGVIGCFLSEYQNINVNRVFDGSEFVITKKNTEKLIRLLPEAAAYGVLLHSAGGEIAAKKYGQRSMKAGNILQGIRECLTNEEIKKQ